MPTEKLDRGEVEPGFGAGDRRLEVFGEAAVAIEPSKGAFDKPAAQEGVEIVIALIRPLSVLGEPV